VFNSEPGRPSGNLVSRRKGAAFIELEVTRRTAHSGAAHAEGVSAIEALARKIQRLHRLTDYDLGTTVNVGLAQGGTAVNTVAARATAAIDVRFPTLNIMEKILGEVREICRCCELPGSDSRILREGNFLPLEQDEASHKLLELYDRSAADLGFRVSGEATGGSADSGFTAALGTPTLCGTGPVGGNAHRDDEWCRIDSIVHRHDCPARPGVGADDPRGGGRLSLITIMRTIKLSYSHVIFPPRCLAPQARGSDRRDAGEL